MTCWSVEREEPCSTSSTPSHHPLQVHDQYDLDDGNHDNDDGGQVCARVRRPCCGVLARPRQAEAADQVTDIAMMIIILIILNMLVMTTLLVKRMMMAMIILTSQGGSTTESRTWDFWRGDCSGGLHKLQVSFFVIFSEILLKIQVFSLFYLLPK